MNKKQYIDVLTAQAEANHRPHEMALSDFLDFLLELFSADAFKGGTEHYAKHVLSVTQKNSSYTLLALQWLADVSEAMEKGEWLDAWGILYEELYLTRGKASNTGQFFTPQSLSDLMARVAEQKGADRGKVNDCACGSGRLLLSHYIEKTRLDHAAGRKFEYIAQDSDPVACKMCALNMMAHGMYGRVVCQNTLTLSTPQVVYHLNEVKYPINTPYYSIRAEVPEQE